MFSVEHASSMGPAVIVRVFVFKKDISFKIYGD